jgi:methylmalonyl-CoA mutase
MLRVTTETFSGICGGCDGLSVGPFDEVIGETDDFSRRIARNVQIILRDECHFHRVIDPAGGSWYVERLTRELAEKAWTLFQEVERRGGMPAALEAGFVQQKTAEVARARGNNLSTRKDVLVGTNKYPNLDEKPVAKDAADPAAVKNDRADAVRRFRGSVDDASVQTALEGLQVYGSGIEVMLRAITCARAGATIGEMARALWTGDPATIDPVHIHRGGEIFERIRSRTEEYAKRTGNPAKIFLANMGPIPQHKPRADFTTGFFQVGGFHVMGNDGFDTIEAAVEAAADSGAKAVVICSTDDAYPEIVPALTKQLKAKDPEIMVILAGYPEAHVDAFREAGIDLFIHIRANLPEVLETVQKHVGVT